MMPLPRTAGDRQHSGQCDLTQSLIYLQAEVTLSRLIFKNPILCNKNQRWSFQPLRALVQMAISPHSMRVGRM